MPVSRMSTVLLACSFLAATPLPAGAAGQEKPGAFTRVAANGYIPAWFPDGSRLAYGSTEAESYEIWTVDPEGRNVRQLTRTGGFHPAVSPDGRYVTYDDRGARGRIFRIPSDGGDAVRITPETKEANFSSWSPDGATIIFSSEGDIWSIPSEGGEATRLIARAGDQIRPAYSPDGGKIAFDSAETERGGDRDIWVCDADGKNCARLTDDPGKETQPDWSPDGTMIAYTSERSGNRDVWIMKADGTAALQVTFHEGADVWPRWSPDGRRIAFGSDRSGSLDIWIVDLESLLGDAFPKKTP